MEKQPKSGGVPETFGVCTECGNVYPVQETGEDDYRPVGTGGTCQCGNGRFRLVDDD